MPRLLIVTLSALALALCCGPDPVPRGPRPSAEVAERLPPGCLARFGDARLRHDAPVTSLALTADGKLLATSTGTDPVVRLWDVATAKLVREVRVEIHHTKAFTLVGFAPDGRRLLVLRDQAHQAVGLDEKWCEPGVLDTATGELTRWPWGSTAALYLPGLAIAPDGLTVAGIERSALKLWDFGTGRELRTLGGVRGGWYPSLTRACYSPDGTQVAASDEHAALYVAPTDGRSPLRAFTVAASVQRIADVFWASPSRVVGVWHSGLAALDSATGKVVARQDYPNDNMLVTPRVSGGGSLHVKGERDYRVQSIDLDTLKKDPRRVFPCGWRDGPLAASADGTTLAVGCGHAVRLYDAQTGASRHPELDLYPADPAVRLHLSDDGRRLLSADGHAAQTWDLPGGQRRATVAWANTHGSPHWSLSPDGRRVAGAYDAAGRVLVHDAATGAVVARGPEAGEYGPHVSAVGLAGPDRVWVWDRNARAYSRVETQGWRPGLAVSDYEYPSFQVVSPDGRRIAASGRVALAVIATDPLGPWVEVESYRDRPGPECGLSPPPCAIPVRISPDNRYLVTSYGSYALWDVSAKPRLVGYLPSHNNREWQWDDVSFSADSRRVVAASRDAEGKTTVRVWDTATAAESARLDIPGGVSTCAFLPDGRLLVAHPDTTFSVWDVPAPKAR